MPSQPYLVYGTVVDENSSVVVESTTIVAYDTTTSEKINTAINSVGQYVLDLANLVSGYTVGDSITVYVRHNGYRGESTFTIADESQSLNFSTSNRVTFATLRNTLWKAIRDTLYSGTFAVSESSIYSAMNDKIIETEGYPLIIIFVPTVDRDGLTLDNLTIEGKISLMVQIYHTSSENSKVLADEVENKFWLAQEVWDGLGLSNLEVNSVDADWYTEGSKKIHIIGFEVKFDYGGSVVLP